ncbi:phosphohydrolase, partial [Klebsiella pneumoniae]|nr:phosphohydrolase [Klebsiella pneumoniae]
QSLELQGGVFTPAQADAFATQSHALAAVRLRRYDDLAKVVGLSTPGLGHYMEMAGRCLRAG